MFPTQKAQAEGVCWVTRHCQPHCLLAVWDHTFGRAVECTTVLNDTRGEPWKEGIHERYVLAESTSLFRALRGRLVSNIPVSFFSVQ